MLFHDFKYRIWTEIITEYYLKEDLPVVLDPSDIILLCTVFYVNSILNHYVANVVTFKICITFSGR